MSFSGPTLGGAAVTSGTFFAGELSGDDAGKDIPSRELRFSKLLPAGCFGAVVAASTFCINMAI